MELFPYAMEWILDLKARGYHVYILSNYSENMLDQTKDKLKFLPLMDGVVFSYKIKKMKPDPEFMNICVMNTGWNRKKAYLLMIVR